MKIRTRLLLSLLPALIGSTVLIGILLYHPRIDIAIGGIALLMALIITSLYCMAGRISAPIQKLNNSALTIAAGQYGESIQAEGPRELRELANTLNTMSQCLLENINRLKETSILQDKIAGEAECARLLQNLLLQKNIDECATDSFAIKAISFSSPSPRGLLVDFPHPGQPEIMMAEANLEGFDGIYQLLTQYKLSKEHPKKNLPFPFLRLSLDQDSSTISIHSSKCIAPYLWSTNTCELSILAETHSIEAGDFVIFINQGFFSFFKGHPPIADLLNRVLKHFSQDGLETIVAMLNKEIAFAVKHKDLSDDLHLLCIQILNPT